MEIFHLFVEAGIFSRPHLKPNFYRLYTDMFLEEDDFDSDFDEDYNTAVSKFTASALIANTGRQIYNLLINSGQLEFIDDIYKDKMYQQKWRFKNTNIYIYIPHCHNEYFEFDESCLDQYNPSIEYHYYPATRLDPEECESTIKPEKIRAAILAEVVEE